MKRMNDLLPWWTNSTVRMVEKLINPEFNVYEFGAGYSTVWLAYRVKAVMSIENDVAWISKIRGEVLDRGLHNVNIQFEEIASGEFIQHILNQKDESFDLVVVDSAFRRVEAFERALPKVKRGGFILLDDSQNLSWKGCWFIEGVKEWESSVPEKGKQATLFRRL